MHGLRSGYVAAVLGLLLSSSGVEAGRDAGSTVDPPETGTLSFTSSSLTTSIGPSSKDWVRQELVAGRSVVLTNSYLFQVMKGISQANQKAVEEALLIPLLTRTLKGMVQAAGDPDLRRLFAVPLVVLTGDEGKDFHAEVLKQAQEINRLPLFSPRGHYTDSPDLRRYFRAMQYLAKATIDVSIDKRSFPFPKEMLFRFETAGAVDKLLSNPDNHRLLDDWKLIHDFYSGLNGPPDLPTFVDLAQVGKGGKLTQKTVLKWAGSHNMPRINPESGIGIQPLGERFAIHEKVIDETKQKLIKDDTPRDKIAELLRFTNLLDGFELDGHRIKGLDESISGETNDSYYLYALQAISEGAKRMPDADKRQNFHASGLTSLAEQTALMTKVSILVGKSSDAVKPIPKGMALYFEPGSEKYLRALARTSANIFSTCRRLSETVEVAGGKDLRMIDAAPGLEAFAHLAGRSKPLVTESPLWEAHGHLVTKLTRDPAVTVDVFNFKDRSGKMSYYQWAVSPFLSEYSTNDPKTKLGGLIMVFFEGWSDEIVPGADGPLNSQQWQNRLLQGDLSRLRSLVTLPGEKEPAK